MGRYIVLGSGSIGRRHHENLTRLGADVRLLSWRGLSIGDLEAALEGATGLVVATATQVRLAPVQAAAERGLAVYIEKPLAFRTGDLSELMAAVAPVADRSVAGFMMRYHPAVRALFEDQIDAFRLRLRDRS